MVSSCSTKRLTVHKLEPLPEVLSTSCLPLKEFTGVDSRTNFLWIMDTITKYKECSYKKDALTNMYNQMVEEKK